MSTATRTVTGPDGETIQSEVSQAPQDSIELSTNAKGEPSFCVKVYGQTSEEIAQRLGELRAIAEDHAAKIRASKAAP